MEMEDKNNSLPTPADTQTKPVDDRPKPVKRPWDDVQKKTRFTKTGVFKSLIPVGVVLIYLLGYLAVFREHSGLSVASGAYIGIVEVQGVILSSNAINKQLNELKNNPRVKGIILRINSPGGTVGSSQEIHDMVLDVSKTKKIYISMSDVAASGGLYIAMGADKVFANPGTITGSIGVILQSYNVEKLMTTIGVRAIVYKSGKKKDILSLYRAPTEEETDILQNLINDTYGQFVNAVAQGRGMSNEEVEEIADGRIFNGAQALDVGLIDGLSSFNGVFNELKKELKIPDATLLDSRESIEKLLEYVNSRLNILTNQNILQKLNLGMLYILPGWNV